MLPKSTGDQSVTVFFNSENVDASAVKVEVQENDKR